MKRLLIALTLLCASWISWPAYALSGPFVPPSEVEAILLAHNWNPYSAHTFAYSITVELADLAHTEGLENSRGYTKEGCPYTNSKVYIEQTVNEYWRPDYIEHEMHHVADWSKDCSYHIDEIEHDYFSLVGYPFIDAARERAKTTPPQPDTVMHYNHDLIVYLNWNINRLPQWYIDKYFWYMQPPPYPTSVPVPTATVPPSPTPRRATLTQRTYLPRVDLKIAS